MDEESRKYVHVYIDNIFKTYDGEDETIETISSQLSKCTEEFMSSTEYEKSYYHEITTKVDQYCFMDKEITL